MPDRESGSESYERRSGAWAELGFEVHQYRPEGEAIVSFSHQGNDWLIAEESSYEGDSEYHFDIKPNVEAPFRTDGEQTVVDLSHGLIFKERFSAEEGSIQGLVYALDALLQGGELSPERYAAYIREEIIPPDFAQRSRSLSESELAWLIEVAPLAAATLSRHVLGSLRKDPPDVS